MPWFRHVKHREFETELSDKRDVFPFSFVRMSHEDSSIVTGTFYKAVRSELLCLIGTTFFKKMF